MGTWLQGQMMVGARGSLLENFALEEGRNPGLCQGLGSGWEGPRGTRRSLHCAGGRGETLTSSSSWGCT